MRVRAIVVHNNYRPTTRDNDIAVIQLERPITFTRNIHRVCLPAATQSIIPGSIAYVTGWGSLTYGGKCLRKIKQLNDILSVTCYYGNSFLSFDTGSHFNPGWLGIHYVTQAALKFIILCFSHPCPQMMGIGACTLYPALYFFDVETAWGQPLLQNGLYLVISDSSYSCCPRAVKQELSLETRGISRQRISFF